MTSTLTADPITAAAPNADALTADAVDAHAAGIYKSAEGARVVRARYLDALGAWPVASRHRRASARAGETSVVACGADDAPPLVLLQGSGGRAALWLADVAAWAAHLRVYAVDLPGEPGLSAPNRAPLASDAHVRWLDDVLDDVLGGSPAGATRRSTRRRRAGGSSGRRRA